VEDFRAWSEMAKPNANLGAEEFTEEEINRIVHEVRAEHGR
jgi:hypothetical protein